MKRVSAIELGWGRMNSRFVEAVTANNLHQVGIEYYVQLLYEKTTEII